MRLLRGHRHLEKKEGKLQWFLNFLVTKIFFFLWIVGGYCRNPCVRVPLSMCGSSHVCV